MKKFITLSVLVLASFLSFGAGHTVSMTGVSAATCFSFCNGSATAVVSGGTGPFTYLWSPSGGTAATATGLCAGAYTVTVTDNSDMSTATASVTITQPPPLSLAVSGGGVCSGGCTTLTTSVTGGTPAYTYAWSGGLFGPSPTVCPGSTTTYTVTVTDGNGCATTNTATVSVSVPPTTTVPSDMAYCNGATIPSGVFSSTPAGATFSWTNSNTSIGLAASGTGSVPSFIATNTGTSPISAMITVTATSAGCAGPAASYMITVDPDVVVTVPPSYTVCSGNVVCLSASATGGAMTYSWTPGTSLSSTTTPNPCASPLFTTTYTVTVTNGTCTGTATTTVYVDGPVTATIATMNTTDCTVCNGSATVTASGGSAPYAYYWTPAGVTTVTDGSLCVGSYSVIVTDINGCTAMANTVINADNGAASNFTVVPDSTNAYNFFFFNSSVGAGASYYWEFGDGAGSPAATPSHTYGSAGTMTVCLTTNSSLCSNSDTLCLPVTVSGSLASCVALFNIADDTTSSDPNALYVYNLSYGATLSYLWDFGDGSTSTLAAPSHVYSGTGPYNLCLTVDNGAGCSDTYCDMLTQVDSLNRSMGLSIQVFDVPPFQGLTTSADAMNPVESVDVFPNPFSETTKFSINDKNNDVYSFELKDVLGKKVIERSAFTEKQFAVSRDGLREGIYFYRISSSKGVLGIGKVIVR